jgi:hypothetical protein
MSWKGLTKAVYAFIVHVGDTQADLRTQKPRWNDIDGAPLTLGPGDQATLDRNH